MPGDVPTGPRARASRALRLPLLLVVTMLLAELLDVLGAAHGGAEALTDAAWGLHALPGVAGLATAGALGWWLERREAARPCTSWTRRLTATCGVLLLGLTAQELLALGVHAGHGDGLAELAAHVAEWVLPVVLGLGALLAVVVGVARVVGRSRAGGAPTA
ncbi:hypothetical protein ACVU7I_15785, partial [Patulibacter sp. S7RM1-6]